MTDHQSEWVLPDEMIGKALNVWFDQGVVADRTHPQHAIAMRAAITAALSAAPSAPQADQGLVELLKFRLSKWLHASDKAWVNTPLRELRAVEQRLAFLEAQNGALIIERTSLIDTKREQLAAESAQIATLTSQLERAKEAKVGNTFTIKHDGFTGTVQGQYVTREGKRGVVLQQEGTRVVHVYGEKWLKPVPAALQGGEGA